MVASSLTRERSEQSLARRQAQQLVLPRLPQRADVRQGMSFSGFERNKVWLNAGGTGSSTSSDIPGPTPRTTGARRDRRGLRRRRRRRPVRAQLQRERHALYRNDVARHRGARLPQAPPRATSSQYEAVGAIVVARDRRAARGAGAVARRGFASCQPPESCSAWAPPPAAEVEVIWPAEACSVTSRPRDLRAARP